MGKEWNRILSILQNDHRNTCSRLHREVEMNPMNIAIYASWEVTPEGKRRKERGYRLKSAGTY